MPPKAAKKIVFDIESTEHFQELVSPENIKILIVDFFLEWCGPCKVMEPNYRPMYFSYDFPDQRIDIRTCEVNNICPEWLAQHKEAVGEFTCKPKFGIFLEGELKGIVEGADYSAIADYVNKYIPYPPSLD